MCAYLFQPPNTPDGHTLIFIGNITNEHVCDPFLFFPDSHGQRQLINGHTYGADITDSGGTLYFDDKIFHFVKDSI
jgi:hypothetical protein